MSEDLNKLRELAEAATPGPWKATNHPESRFVDAVASHEGRKVAYCQPLFGRPHVLHAQVEANAAFIAAFNPATALSLIARLQAAEERAEKAEAALRIISDGTVSSAPEGHYLAHRAAVKVARAALKTEGA